MRHNDARKWLHAVLDLLPVLLIPVFMIYSHRHDMTQQTQVDIQYKYQSNEVNTYDDLVIGNIYYCDELVIDRQDLDDRNYGLDFVILQIESLVIDYQEIDEVYVDYYENNDSNYIEVYLSENSSYASFSNANGYVTTTILNDAEFYYFTFVCNTNIKNWFIYYELDLPQYTDYNLIESVEVHDQTSSVMNVFMDNFNTAVDKYFNMGNVFNLNGVYQWFNTNIFGGNAPQIIYSVWNIALYELVMDLLFLLYGLFMWFIDMCKHLMEKPFRSIK